MKTVLIATLLLSLPALAKDIGKILVTEAQIYAPLKGTPATAAYAQFENTGDQSVILKVIGAPLFKAVETHETSEKAGRMSMQKVESFTIPAKGRLLMKPGGNHVMLFGPNREVKDGEVIDIAFSVNGKSQSFPFKVVPRTQPSDPGAAAADSHAGHH